MNRLQTKTARLRSLMLLAATLLATAPFATAQVAMAQSIDTPMTRLRPIGSPSAVDLYQPSVRTVADFQETAYGVRQAAMQFAMPTLPDGSPPVAAPLPQNPNLQNPSQAMPVQPSPVFAPPPTRSVSPAPLPPSLPSSPLPPPSTAPMPRGLPTAPALQNPAPLSSIRSSSDLSPIAPPQLGGGGFATIYNCSNVSPASSYSAASGIGCGQSAYQAPVGYGPVVAPAYAPTTLPPGAITAPIVIPPANAAPVGPLMSFGQSANPVQVGPGLFGQPKAYVPGQGIRNWLRYFTP